MSPRKLRRRSGSWILAVLFAVVFVFPSSSKATSEPGINVTVYNNFGYNGSPPLPNVSGRPSVGTTTVNQINQDFDSEPMFGMYEDFIVKYEGYITSPVTGDITFYPYADDGTKFYLNGVLIDDNWVDKGGGGNPTPPQSFVAGVSKPFTYWYYENGGGANTQLFWDTGEGFEMVPASAFTKSAVPTTTTTTIAPYFNPPTNLTALIVGDSQVKLTWESGEPSNTEPYMWNITWFDMDSGERSGGWGIWTYANMLTATITLGSDTSGYGDTQFTVSAGTAPCVGEGQGSCLYGPSAVADISISVPTTTTSTTTTSTTTTEPDIVPPPVETIPTENTTVSIPTENTTVSIPEPDPTPVEVTPVETPTSESYPEADGPAASVPQYAPEQETTTQTDEPPVVVPEDTQDAADNAVADIFDGPMSDAGLANAVDDLVADAGTPEELTAVVNSLLDQELTDAQFSTVIDSVFDGPMSDENFSAAVNAVFDDTSALSDEQFDAAVQAVFDGPLSTEQFSDALEAVFDEPISDEKFDAIIDAVLDEPLSDEQFAELVNVLESETVTEEQVAAAVDSVIENGVTEDQATDLATSEKVLQSIDGEQATEIFDAVDIGEVTPEEAAALVEAVQDAPTEVREAMESEINVFDGAIDTYVPLGSAVDVQTRRAVIAAGVVLSTSVIAAAPPSSPSGPSQPSSGGGGGPSGGPSGGSGSNESSNRRRRGLGK